MNARNILGLFITSLVFIGVNSIFLHFEIYYFSLIPIVLFFTWLCFYSLDLSLLLLAFLVPVSIQLRDVMPGLDFNLYLPTEPLMLLMTVIFWLKFFLEGTYPKAILKHPLTLAIFFHLGWLFITTISSTMPLVSVKFLISKIWFITSFYFIAILVFRKKENMHRYLFLFAAGLSLVVIYAITKLAGSGLLNQAAAHSSSSPIFTDHTSFGAVIAMTLLAILGFLPAGNYRSKNKILIWLVVLILIVGLSFSYSRAAWISSIAAVGIYIVVKLKVKPIILLTTSLLTVLIIFFSWTQIIMKLEKNKQDSSTDIGEQIQSISNISSDASNLERINRWEAALRMYKEKPLFGWGPGTYMFQYAGFQSSRNRTIISTNFGNRGNAHSEYLGPLSETGIPGALSIIIIISLAIYHGISYYLRGREVAWLALAVSIGLISYAVHGLLNNFLDTDKASALFWGYMAIIVALDVFGEDEKMGLAIK